mgnify:CR=1 FL=1
MTIAIIDGGYDPIYGARPLKRYIQSHVETMIAKEIIGGAHTAGDTLTVYTTRCDTLFGATYMVVSPEHAMVKQWLDNGAQPTDTVREILKKAAVL